MKSTASFTETASTLKEALATLRGAKRVYLHCRVDGFIPGDAKHYRPGHFTGALRVAKPAAIDFLKQAFNKESDTFMRISVRLDEGVTKWDRVKQEVITGGLVKTVWLNASA